MIRQIHPGILRGLLIAILLAGSGTGLTAQEDVPAPVLPAATDSLAADTIPAAARASGNTGYPVPKRALLWSAIPGGGQAYNKRWWKLPLVYGGLYALVRTINYNQGVYRRLKTAYALKLDDEPHEFSGTNIDNASTLRNLRDRYDKRTQTAYVGLVLGYVIQGIEAYVDAHLRHFDISDDLSVRLKPTFEIQPVSGQPVLGIGLSMPIGR